MNYKLRIIAIAIIFLLTSCKTPADDPLIVPPGFNDMPKITENQPKTKEQEDKEVERLKELLLKSE